MLSFTTSAAQRSYLPIGGALPTLVACLITCASFVPSARSQEIPLINPGGEAYDTSAGNFVIPESPIPPGDGTGWNASTDRVTGDHAVEGIANNPNTGTNRLAFGAAAASTTFLPEDIMLFQETSHTVAAGEELVLSFSGRGFFDFQNDQDDLASVFGYLDSNDDLVQVDTKAHTNIVSGLWNQAGHSFLVPNGSPLVGENLTIGFFTKSLDGGGFSSIDDVGLMLGAGNPLGDADGDGDVDDADVQLIADNFLNDVPVSTLGDLDDNSVVNFADFRIWKDASGSSASFESIFAVPEPSAIWLAASATLALLWRTRRGEA